MSSATPRSTSAPARHAPRRRGGAVPEDFLADTLTALVDTLEGVVTALDPLLDTLNQLVSITINSQTDLSFSDADGDATGATTVRAVRLELVPAADLATVDLATATVQADAFAGVVITDPEDGSSTTVPAADDTTDTPVSGTAEPGSDVTVTLDGDEAGAQTTTTGDDGTWTVTFPDVAVGDHEAVAVETIGGLTSEPDSVTFAVVAAPVDPTDPPTTGPAPRATAPRVTATAVAPVAEPATATPARSAPGPV